MIIARATTARLARAAREPSKKRSDELNRKWPANWFLARLGKNALEFFEIPIITKFPLLPSGGGGRLEMCIHPSAPKCIHTFFLPGWIDAASAKLVSSSARLFFSCLVPEFLSRGRPWIMCQGDEHTNSHFQFSNQPLHQLLYSFFALMTGWVALCAWLK